MPLSQGEPRPEADLVAQAADVGDERAGSPGRWGSAPTPSRSGRPAASPIARSRRAATRSPDAMFTGAAHVGSASAANAPATSSTCRKSRTWVPRSCAPARRPAAPGDRGERAARVPRAARRGRTRAPRRARRRPAPRARARPRAGRAWPRRRASRARAASRLGERPSPRLQSYSAQVPASTARRPPRGERAQQRERRLHPAQVLGRGPEPAVLGVPGEVQQVRRRAASTSVGGAGQQVRGASDVGPIAARGTACTS